MRLLVIGLVALFTLGFASGACADGLKGGAIQTGSGGPIDVPEGNRDFIHGWNEDQPLDDSWTYGASCFGIAYSPPETYWLQRIEFMAGGVPGPASIVVHADDGSGLPTGPVLASGSFDQVADLGWQGADLDPCLLVEQGALYYINYHVVVGSNCSFALTGVIYPHSWGDCTSWSGPGDYFYWMAKFFGGYEASGAENSTWTGVKFLYR